MHPGPGSTEHTGKLRPVYRRGAQKCPVARPTPRQPGGAAPDLAWLPSGPGGPGPTPNSGPRRRWQRHLHIWRPCSRFRDGDRVSVTSPRTLRRNSRGGLKPGTNLGTWRRGRKGRGSDSASVRVCVKRQSQSRSPCRACVVPKAGASRQSGSGWTRLKDVRF